MRLSFRRTAPKQSIPFEEWQQILFEAEAATELLESEKFEFVRLYLQHATDYIEKTFARQSINDAYVDDYFTNSNGQVSIIEQVKRVFFPAKKEYASLAGEYKFIERFLGDLALIKERANEVRKRRDAGQLEIEDTPQEA